MKREKFTPVKEKPTHQRYRSNVESIKGVSNISPEEYIPTQITEEESTYSKLTDAQ